MITYCVRCLLPSTKPDLWFDAQGVCAACLNYAARDEVDWAERGKNFGVLVDGLRASSDSPWDCVIPVSGGKDSTAQVVRVISEGLRPLCVTASTCDLSELGQRNIDNLRSLGVDHVQISPNPLLRARLNRVGLLRVGDISWPEHVGIFTIPVRLALAYRVPMVLWGENPQNEYGGPIVAAGSATLTRRWLEEFGGLLGLRVGDLPDMEGIRDSDLALYQYPSELELEEAGLVGVFLGHFFPWDGYSNSLIAQLNGFESFGKSVEGSGVDYENLDNHQTGIHDYFKFLKFGFGRATDIASSHIRRGRLTRNQGLKMVRDHDGRFPWTYLGKPLHAILTPLELSVEEFISVCDDFTNRALFKADSSGKLLKDRDGNLTKINYDNVD